MHFLWTCCENVSSVKLKGIAKFDVANEAGSKNSLDVPIRIVGGGDPGSVPI